MLFGKMIFYSSQNSYIPRTNGKLEVRFIKLDEDIILHTYLWTKLFLQIDIEGFVETFQVGYRSIVLHSNT